MASRVFLLLCTLLVLDATQAKLQVLADPSTIVANPGDKVTLKCTMQNIEVDVKNLVIQWFTRGKQVAEFDDKISIRKPGLTMSLDDINKGDGTLTIESFKAEDAGRYRCYLTHGHENAIKEIVLQTNKTASAEEEEEDLLTTCETVLDKKLDKVINMLEKFETKLEELSKGCPPRYHGKN